MTPSGAPIVLVVGAGPTGLAAANVLGKAGIDTLVVERDDAVATEPRAVSVDDEAMRLLQSIGCAGRSAPTIRPGTGTRYYGARGQLLAAAAPPRVPPYGHPLKNPIDHGAFTRLLLDELGSHPSVEVRLGHELTALEVDGDGGLATVRETGSAATSHIEARWILGADGGRSAARKLLGIEMEGHSLDEPWLVIDTRDDPHDERYAMHHGDPTRPHVVLPGGGGRCRYEFLLLPGEDETTATSFEMAKRLLQRHRPGLRPEDVIRQRVYVFHALVAAAWRKESAFLLGDAAHMMPPFAGQGLGTGLKDAANLAWKIAAVAQGQLTERALDSYERERRPHAQAMVAMSVRRGRVVMTTSRARARARDAAAAAMRRVPPLRQRLDAVTVKPPARHADGMVVRLGGSDSKTAPSIAGAMLPQPRVLHADGTLTPLDEVLGPWFALIAIEPAAGVLQRLGAPEWDRLGARRLRLSLEERFPPQTGEQEPAAFADADGLLAEPLAGCQGNVLVVRPDRFVLGLFTPDQEHDFLTEWSRLGGPVAAESAAAAFNGTRPDHASTPLRSPA